MVVFVVVLYQYRDRDNVCVVMPTLLVGKKSQSSSFANAVVEWGASRQANADPLDAWSG